MSDNEEEENDGQADFDAILVRLRTVSDVLGECGETCNKHGAMVIAGMIGAATLIVEELIVWMAEQKSQPSEDEPS